MRPVVIPKQFSKQLRALMQIGKRNIYQKASTVMQELQTQGEVTSIKLTKHGESRADVLKYDLSDGYRIVIQALDASVVCLCVGTHDEVDGWLKAHKDYQYIERSGDKSIQFVKVSEENAVYEPKFNPENIVDTPIFGFLENDDWSRMGIDDTGIDSLKVVLKSDWEDGSILDKLPKIVGVGRTKLSLCLLDVAESAYEGELNQARSRLELFFGAAIELPPGEAVKKIVQTKSSEEFITFDDPEELENFLKSASWQDWHLFLHPAQRGLTRREYNGPARVRGISGSGKTSIAVHRAKFLVEKWKRPILIMSLTRSLTGLLESLVDSLCGRDSRSRSLVRVSTIHSVAIALLNEFDPEWIDARSKDGKLNFCDDAMAEKIKQDAIDATKLTSPQGGVEGIILEKSHFEFVCDEIDFVRSTFESKERENYLDDPRTGRRVGLNRDQRESVLRVVGEYEGFLSARNLVDSYYLVMRALDITQEKIDWRELFRSGDYPYPFSRCVVVDESQDMSENELRLAKALAPPLPDSLFLVGDGAQKIYNRGFSFSKAGIDVVGRSTVLRKNYRNTKQLLRAAYPLVTKFVNEGAEDSSSYLEGSPDFSSREGLRPQIHRFKAESSELTWVVNKARELVSNGVPASSICVIAPTHWLRQKVSDALTKEKFSTVSLRRHIHADDRNSIRISTIEAAKGHEFAEVVICGLAEELLPSVYSIKSDDLWIEAAKLYVALTRARDNAYLLSSKTYGSKAYEPSRFLEVIEADCDVSVH